MKRKRKRTFGKPTTVGMKHPCLKPHHFLRHPRVFHLSIKAHLTCLASGYINFWPDCCVIKKKNLPNDIQHLYCNSMYKVFFWFVFFPLFYAFFLLSSRFPIGFYCQ